MAMSMKWSIFKTGVILIAFFFCVTAVIAQENSEQKHSKYEERIERYQKGWSRLIPRYVKVQYAGSMGLFSLGVGWIHGKRERWETDLMLGYIPEYSTKRGKICITVKENFIPWKIEIGQKGLALKPLTCGLYINSIFDKDFWLSDPSKYPNSYYTFSTKLRFNIFVGQQLTYRFPLKERSWVESVSFFYEISSNELYLLSAFGNSYLKPIDYLNLSLGVRFLIF
jgi:hypothetical protein